MLQPTLDYLKANRLTNALFWVSVTILLGAIGSGLWETVLSPVSSFIGRTIVSTFTQFSESYSDSLHKRISKDGVMSYSVLPFAFTAGVMTGLPWITPLLIKAVWRRRLRLDKASKNKKSNAIVAATSIEDAVKSYRLLFHFGWILALVSSLLYGHEAYQATYAYRAATFTERSLDILAPKLSEDERLRLRADYRSVDSASDFSNLYDRLIALAKERNIKLPKFDPILRKGRG